MSTETTTLNPGTTGAVAEFTIEFGDNKNRTIVIATIRQKARGHFSLRKFYQGDGGGRDIGPAMQRVPDIPGLFMRIKPKDGKAILYDPWEDKPEEWKRVNEALTTAHAARGGKYGPVLRSEMSLTPDQMKTLVLEAVRLVEDDMARVVKGALPTAKQIEKMPGRQLFDPLNSGRKPRYVEDVAEWEQRIDSGSV